MNLLNLFEDDNSTPGPNYAEELAHQIFKVAPKLDATGAADEVLDYAFDLAVHDLGRKRAHSLFAYDADFDGDLVSAYAHLQRQVVAEVDPRNFDSDEDYYDAVDADDLDLDKFGNGWDIPDEIAVLRNQLRHTTSQYARDQIENKIKRYEDIYYGEDDLEEDAPVADLTTGTTNQTYTPPSRGFGVMIKLSIPGSGLKEAALEVWEALEAILPRDYPRVPFQQQSGNEPQVRVIEDLKSDGFSIVKQQIGSQDIAQTIANKFESRSIPAEVIDSGIFEEYDPAQASKFISAATKAAKIMFDFERGYNQAFRAELQNQYGFDPDSPGYEVSPHKATELIKWLNSKGCELSFNKKEPIEFALTMPGQSQPYEFNILDMIQGGEVNEGMTRKVDAKGRTQQQWIQAVYKKFPDARIVQAKMIDGPCHAMLADGRKISWTPVEQDVAEAKASTAAFRASNAKRAKLNAMTPEERKEYDKEQAEKQRKRDDARLEKERQKLAAKKKVSEADKKKDDAEPEIKDVVLQRAISRAKADFPTAGSGIEALAKDFMRSQEQDQKSLDQIRDIDQQQDRMLNQIDRIDQQQNDEIAGLEDQNSSLTKRLQQLQSVNNQLEKKLASMSGRKADKKSSADNASVAPSAPSATKTTKPIAPKTKAKTKDKSQTTKSSMKSTAAQLAAPKADPMAAMTDRITRGDSSVLDKVSGQAALPFEPSDNVLEPTIPQRQQDPRFAAARRDASDVDPRYYADLTSKIAKKAIQDPETAMQTYRVHEGDNEEQEDNKIGGRYDPDEFDAMVARVGQKAREQEKNKPVDIADLARRLAAIEASHKDK